MISPPYLQNSIIQKFAQQLAYENQIRSFTNPWEQKKYIVGMIKAAALFTREYMQDMKVENDVFMRDQLLASIPKVIWAQKN